MQTKEEIREFLTSRRAQITPERAGLTSYGGRRVPGLRREEVAVLAGVSVPYYTRLERGDMNGVSESVLDALARALQLDDAERAHLFDLARAARPTAARPRRRQPKQGVRPELQWTLDAITGAAAFVGNERLDILAANQLGHALYSELYAAPTRPVNTARFVFLDPRAETSYGDWERIATETVAILRSAAARDPYDRELSDQVGELATQSEAFRARWAAHNVRFHNTGVKLAEQACEVKAGAAEPSGREAERRRRERITPLGEPPSSASPPTRRRSRRGRRRSARAPCACRRSRGRTGSAWPPRRAPCTARCPPRRGRARGG